MTRVRILGVDPGLRVTDIEQSIADALERLATTLSPRNAHAYLGDLPQDVDVVAVEPVQRKVRGAHRYTTTTDRTDRGNQSDRPREVSR